MRTEKDCPVCGRDFVLRSSRTTNAIKFCSDECRSKHRRISKLMYEQHKRVRRR